MWAVLHLEWFLCLLALHLLTYLLSASISYGLVSSMRITSLIQSWKIVSSASRKNDPDLNVYILIVKDAGKLFEAF